eukprot:snap_masked-scaffold623_size123039-processed-gene-0.5 protein:Tk02783 transcript:snap_masked-scaffold623_size123039-processed-gene-0.5-mRNA-1 annotation:"hypothetical protein DAPPUDRAFT_302459"
MRCSLLVSQVWMILHLDGTWSDQDFVKVCDSPLGFLSVSPKAGILLNIPDENRHVNTIFVHRKDFYDFHCHSKIKGQTVRIVHEEVKKGKVTKTQNITEFQTNEIVSRINADQLTNDTPMNTRNSSIQCWTPDSSLAMCEVTLLVIEPKENICHLNQGLDCDAKTILSAFSTARMTSRNRFSEVIKYTFFDQTKGHWIECEKLDHNGTRMVQIADESKVHNIRCPLVIEKPVPVIIRVEQITNNVLSVAIPILGNGPKSSFTYFSLMVNSSMAEAALHEGESLDVWILIVCLVLALVLVLIFGILIHVLLKRRASKGEEEKSSQYSSMVPLKTANSANSYVGKDSVSMRTETTTDYERLMNIFSDPVFNELFQEEEEPDDNPFQSMDKVKLRSIIQKQLSGDPSKINPHLSLNQQVNALSYDPKLEIDRPNFKMGQLLGSGNFGAVYVGEATGLLHPGSVSTVAIKTVSDALDVSQFSSLMGEMKILTNLDLNLNLINLLGSCTTHIDQGELWLLLEYCPHGDLKSYIIKHRAPFSNNIQGLVSTGFDARSFLRWAHHIAKGMEYLSAKKIMHGDLAARNILLDENLTAKVSDFGLSKSMYESIRYKKEKRHFVPWKWMALEFLFDACFTLKSDVWSYGVVLWEIFSLGQEPYPSQEIEETVQAIKNGYRLPFPDEMRQVEWARSVYDQVMIPAWQANPNIRISFEDIVRILETKMFVHELDDYHRQATEYESVRELLFNHETLSKRNTLSRESSAPTDSKGVPNNAYHKLFSMEEDADLEHSQPQNGYVAVSEISSKSRRNTERSTTEEDLRNRSGSNESKPRGSRHSSDQGY